MLAIGALVLAFQVSVNVDVDRKGGSTSGSISIKKAVKRIPVTDELRRTAFKDAGARELLLRARAARLQQDSTLQSYDVKSYARMSAGMSLRETARDRLIFRTENASHVVWRRGVGARVEVLGARQAVPIVSGIKDAEKDIQDDMMDEFSDMMAIPYYPGKDELWLFDMIGGNGPDEEDPGDDDEIDDLIHPVAEGSEAYFTFSSGDSVTMTLPDGTRITLRELLATPREARWNLVVGSFWFETDRAHLVRAVMRFSAPMDIWEQATAEDSTSMDDVPLAVRAFITPMRAEITAVTIEYGLLNQRIWLPRTQGAEGYARVGFMRVPFKIEERYRYNSVNETDTLAAIEAPKRVTSTHYRDSLKTAGLDSTQIRDEMRKFYAERDSAARRDRKAQCDTKGTYMVYERRHDGVLPLAIEVPCDLEKLAHSPELPPSIYDPGEELFGANERAELMRALDFGLQPNWAPQKPVLDWGLPFTRYNRAEGLGTGASLSWTLGKGYTVKLGGRGSLADRQVNGDLGLSRSNGRRELRATLYRQLVASNDFGSPLSTGASIANILYARDEGFYHRAWGGELGGSRVEGNGINWRLFAEQQWNAPVETTWSLFGGAHSDGFTGNVLADQAWIYGAGARWRGSRGLDPLGWRTSAEIKVEGGAVDYSSKARPAVANSNGTYGRAMFETTVSKGLGRVAASLTGSAGSTFGDPPAQRYFFLGGLQSVRGQTAGTGYGEAFWLGRAELGTAIAAARPVIFYDAGWAGNRNAWGEVGRPMSGAGVGVSFLDGMMRFDVARGIYPRVQTRVDFYFEARF